MMKKQLLFGLLLALFSIIQTQAQTNLASTATASANFTQTNFSLAGLKDGALTASGNTTNWSCWQTTRPATNWVQYDWATAQNINKITVIFNPDVAGATGNGGGVAVPESWKVQYSDDGSAWTDVALLTGWSYTKNYGTLNTGSFANTAINTVQFEPVVAKYVRLYMNMQTNGTTYAATRIAEWIVYSTTSTSTPEFLAGWDGGGTAYKIPANVAGWAVTGKTAAWQTNVPYSTGNINPDNFRDITSGTFPPQGRYFYALGGSSSVYFSYPVKLRANKYYRFTGTNWSRDANLGGGNNNVTYSIYSTATGTGGTTYGTQTRNCTANAIYTYDFNFLIPSDGTYYLLRNSTQASTIDGSNGLSLIELGEPKTVTFNTNGGSSVATQNFAPTTSYTITQPSNPTKTDWVFVGWYADAAFTTAFNFATPVTDNTTVYAKFTQDPILTAPQSTLSLTTTTNTGTIDITGTYLITDVSISVPNGITLSGGNVSGTAPTYSIALASANATNTITATWDKTVNVSGNITFTSGTATKSVSVTSTDVESVAFTGITLSNGGLNVPFAVGTTSYTAKVPADITTTTVSATATPASLATVTNSGTAISASSTSVVLTGISYNGANHSSGYTVNWGGNYTLADWSANGSTDAALSIPTVYGWSATPAVGWLAANGNVAGNCRLIDTDANGVNTSAASGVTFTYNGGYYQGRVLLLRWDSGNNGRIFSYPLSLQAGTVYQITGKASSHNGASTLTFGVNSTKSITSPVASGTLTTSTNGLLLDWAITNISVPSTGVYYLNIRSSAGNLADIADLALNTQISQTFSAAVDNNWSNASNWSGRVPLAGDDVTISAGNNIVVDANAHANAIAVAPGAKLSVASGKSLNASSLTLNSDATGNATFVNNGTATVTSATVQQYLTSGRNWYISSPVSNAAVSSLNTATSVLRYDEPSAQFVAVNSGNLTPALGYISSATTGTGTVTFSGTLNDGSITINPTRTYNAPAKAGFNLIGNPYASYLNWDQVSLSSNVSTTMWYRTKNSGNTAYVFDTYNKTGQLGTNNNGQAVTADIPPMQAFWVRVAAPVLAHDTTGTVTFNNTMRAHRGATDLLMRAPAVHNSLQQVLRLQVSNGLNTDETIVLFNPNASNTLDDYDSYKMTNNNVALPEIYTTVGSDNLVINGLNSVDSTPELPLGFTTGQANAFSIRASQVSNFDGYSIYLRDKVLNTETDLTNGTEYNFSSDVTSTASRFAVVFRSTSVSTALGKSTLKNVHVEGKEKQIAISSSESFGVSDRVTVYSITGQQLINEQLTHSSMIVNSSFNPGIYMVTLDVNGQKRTDKVIVK